MMNDVVSDPVGTFVRLAMPPPDINGPLPYQKDASRRLSAACGRLSVFYETLSVQSCPEAFGRHFDVKNL